MIEVKNIGKQFPKDGANNAENIAVEALNEISFSLIEGDVLGVIGSNGAGKTTLLKILGGILKPTNGSATLKGSVNSIIQFGSGFHPDLSGIENLKLNLKLVGVNRNLHEILMTQIIDFSELSEYIDNPVKSYSNGMYLRLAFSMYTHIPCDIILIDEILNVGDVSFIKKSFAKILELKAKGTTFIIASHDLNKLKELCNKGLYLDKGKILHLGDYQTSLQKYIYDVNELETVDSIGGLLYQSDNLTVHRVYFKKAQELIPTFDYTDEIEVCIEYELHKKIEDFDFGIDISDSINPILVDNPLFHGSTKIVPNGICTRHCVIPANLFFTGMYVISFWAGNRMADEVVLKNKLNFNIKPNFFMGLKTYNNGKHVLRPKFKWENRLVS